MTTTPKGFTQIANSDAPNGPAQINGAELFVENLIGESVANVAALPSTGNWVGRSIFVVALAETRVWNGSTWVAPYRAGLVPIIPSSVSGASTPTIDANGKVKWTVAQSASAIGVNGIFSSAFTRYRILLQTNGVNDPTIGTGTTNTQFWMNFTTGGTINTSPLYYGGSNGNSQSVWNQSGNGGHGRIMDFTIVNPFQSVTTRGIVTGAAWDSGSAALPGFSMGIGYAGTDSFDGISFNFSLPSGRAGGELQVFGILD
jgi:hypothetical protein